MPRSPSFASKVQNRGTVNHEARRNQDTRKRGVVCLPESWSCSRCLRRIGSHET